MWDLVMFGRRYVFFFSFLFFSEYVLLTTIVKLCFERYLKILNYFVERKNKNNLIYIVNKQFIVFWEKNSWWALWETDLWISWKKGIKKWKHRSPTLPSKTLQNINRRESQREREGFLELSHISHGNRRNASQVQTPHSLGVRFQSHNLLPLLSCA